MMGMGSGWVGGKLNKTSKGTNAINKEKSKQSIDNVPKLSLLGHGVPGGRPIYIVRSIHRASKLSNGLLQAVSVGYVFKKVRAGTFPLKGTCPKFIAASTCPAP